MKKPFTAPFWFMLIFGIVFTILSVVGLNFYLRAQLRYDVNYSSDFGVLWRGLRWPILALLESFLYWRIRYRNVYPRDTWLHCWLYVLAVVIPVLLAVPAILHYGDSRTLIRVRDITFWLLIVAAHIFFIDALIKSFRYKPPQPAAEDDSGNLLDEFAS